MNEKMLGTFEETILLLVGILEKEAYAFRIAEEYHQQTHKSVSIGAVHSTLNRLSAKGFLSSEMGSPTAERGGRRKRIYSITAAGQQALIYARDLKIALWKQFPAFPSFRLNLG